MQKTPSTLCNHLRTAVLAAALFASASTLHAASYTWDGGATGSAWGTAANWNPDAVPTFDNTADLNFNVLNRATNFIGTNVTVRSMTFGNNIDSDFTVRNVGFPAPSYSQAAYNLTLAANSGNATITVNSGAAGNITIGALVTNGVTVDTNSVGNLLLASNLDIVHDGTGTLLFNRPISTTNAFNFTKTGSGTFQSINNNLITGSLNVNGGRVIAASYTTNGDWHNVSSINLGGGTLQYNTVGAGNKTVTNAINVTAGTSSGLAFNNGDSVNRTLAISGANPFSIGAGANLTVATISTNTALASIINLTRNISGSGNMVVETFNNINASSSNFGLGRVALGGTNNAWSGALDIRKGTAEIYGTNANLLPLLTGNILIGETGNSFGAGLLLSPSANGSATFSNSITVRSGGFRTIRSGVATWVTGADTFYTFNGAVALEGDLNLHVDAINADRRVSVNGNITGVGGLDFTRGAGNGYFVFAGTNTYSGATTINARADVFLNTTNGIGDSSAVTLAGAGSILRLNAAGNETVGSIASSGTNGTIALNNSVLITGGNGSSTTYGGVITGTNTSGLTKVGAGTMTLSGANTNFLGRTIVNGGTLTVNGSLGGGIDVSSGSLLNGSGTIGGASTVNGTLSAGNSPGQMTFSSDLSLGTGSNLVWELFGNTSSDVSKYDRITVGGTLLASSGSGITLDFGTTAGGSTVDWSNSFWDTAQTWTFLTVAGITSGFSNLNLLNTSFLDASGNSLAAARSGSSFSITQSGNDVAISYVPEPSTGSLLLMGLASWALVRATRRTA